MVKLSIESEEDNKVYFQDALNRAFSNIVFNLYGGVCIAVMPEKENYANFRLIAYNRSKYDLEDFDDESFMVINETYDTSGVDFADRYSVLKAINTIVSQIEQKIYE